MKVRLFRVFATLAISVAAILTLILSADITPSSERELFHEILDNYSADTQALNSVTSVYLNYRIFDTIFEALMLLVSVMGVVAFSRHEHIADRSNMEKIEETAKKGYISLLIPGIIMLGCYIIFNGHNSPGGGFQGGAALSATLICVYLVKPSKTIDFLTYQNIEKVVFLAIALISTIFAVSNIYLQNSHINVYYMILMNILIGMKVFCGLSIVFFRFAHYEDK